MASRYIISLDESNIGLPELERAATFYKSGIYMVQAGLSDEALAYLYAKFRDDKVLSLVFHAIPISLVEFLKTYLDPERHTLGCFRADPNGGWTLVGMGWVNEAIKVGKYVRANVGHGFIRHTGTHPLRFAQMMTEWAFEVWKADILMGITPAPNVAACSFARRMGFTLAGPVPYGTSWNGEPCDIMISTLSKAAWGTISPWKKEW